MPFDYKMTDPVKKSKHSCVVGKKIKPSLALVTHDYPSLKKPKKIMKIAYRIPSDKETKTSITIDNLSKVLKEVKERWNSSIQEESPNQGILHTTLPDVAHQTHYTQFKIQPIVFIEVNEIGYCAGNVIKYVCRENLKDGLKDLLKARTYLDCLIEEKRTGVFKAPNELVDAPKA